MNAQLREMQDRQRRRFEEDLNGRVAALFRRCPALCGFTVQDNGPLPADLTCHPAPNEEQAEELLGEVAQMLLDLLDERPEGAELLFSRTFARTVH